MTLPIGGADMPVVITLLNSFTGTAVAMAGFVLDNPVLIIAGALVGASGAILTKLMADAMNRSVINIMLGGFGGGDEAAALTPVRGGSVRSISADDVAIQLAYAQHVIVVPGYGLAVAQAQHAVRELAELLEERGVDVKYAIHPVAGRMPGHMNVLLAEANVPYPLLKEMDEINPEFERADVALVIGANDVTNPAARRPGSPVSGMPILDVDKAKSIVVIKRSMGRGYAGIDNELYVNDKTGMLFADAKDGPRRSHRGGQGPLGGRPGRGDVRRRTRARRRRPAARVEARISCGLMADNRGVSLTGSFARGRCRASWVPLHGSCADRLGAYVRDRRDRTAAGSCRRLAVTSTTGTSRGDGRGGPRARPAPARPARPYADGTTAAVRGATAVSEISSGASVPSDSATTTASSSRSSTKSAPGFTKACPPRFTDSKVARCSVRRRAATASIDRPM